MRSDDILDRALCITLAKRPERTRGFSERYKAATGREARFALGFDGEKLPVLVEWGTTAGAFGACLAHIAAWARALSDFDAEDGDALTFFEDDAVFCENFSGRLARAARLVPDDWDLFYLGGEHLTMCAPRPETIATDGDVSISKAKNVNRLHAYAVRRRAMRVLFPRLLKYATNAPKRYGPSGEETCFDYEIGRIVQAGELTAYAVAPWLCGQGPDGSDTYPESKADIVRYWNL